MESLALSVVEGKYGTKYVVEVGASRASQRVTLPADSGTSVFDAMIEIDGDFGATCPLCHVTHWNSRSELAAWHMAMDCLSQHKQHAQRCPEDIPFLGEPVTPAGDGFGGTAYGLHRSEF